jgi:hypothetical protein
MRTTPVTTVDPANLANLRPYPLGEVRDGGDDAPDFRLEGGVVAPGQKFTYELDLLPGLTYRFAGLAPAAPFSAMLVDADNGEVLWANASGLGKLGVQQPPATDLVQVGERQTVVLIVESASDSEAPFSVFADASAVVPEEFAVYRFLNKSNGQHFITAQEFERDYVLASAPYMQYQGESFFAADVPLDDFVPVYRFANLNNGSYFYTANEAERQVIQEKYGHMRFEGVGFYVPELASEDGVPVYRLANLKTGGYLYTSSLPEKAFFLLSGAWRDEGFAFNAIDPDLIAALDAAVDGVMSAANVPLIGLSSDAGLPAG